MIKNENVNQNNLTEKQKYYIKYFTNVKKLGLIRRTNWWYKFLTRNIYKLNLENNKTILSICNTIDKIITVNNEHYGNNWDFHITPNSDGTYSFEIVYYFKKITIRNSNNIEHTIQDLFISFPFYLDSELLLQINNIIMFRGTQSSIEHKKNYGHSHISSVNLFESSSICLGSSDFSRSLSSLKNNFDIDIFEMIISSLETTFSWESLEGKPYKYISSLKEKSNNIKHLNIIPFQKVFTSNIILKQVIKLLNSKNFVYENGVPTIKEDSNFEDILKSIIINIIKNIILSNYVSNNTDLSPEDSEIKCVLDEEFLSVEKALYFFSVSSHCFYKLFMENFDIEIEEKSVKIEYNHLQFNLQNKLFIGKIRDLPSSSYLNNKNLNLKNEKVEFIDYYEKSLVFKPFYIKEIIKKINEKILEKIYERRAIKKREHYYC